MLEVTIFAALGLLGAFAIHEMSSGDEDKDDDGADNGAGNETPPVIVPVPGDGDEDGGETPVNPETPAGQINITGSGTWSGTAQSDTFVNTSGRPLVDTEVDMGAGNDRIRVSASGSSFHGGDGNDTIHVRGDGNDLYGGAGNDRLWAHGFDGGLMDGGEGNDRLYVHYTNDAASSGRIIGGEGNDTITADIELNNNPDHAPLLIQTGSGENVVDINLRNVDIGHAGGDLATGVRITDFDPETDHLIITLPAGIAAEFEHAGVYDVPGARTTQVQLHFFHDAGRIDGVGDYSYTGIVELQGQHVSGALRGSDIEIRFAPAG